MTRRLAVLAQFDPANGLPSHVRLHLEGLRPVVERLVLVSNSPLDPASRTTAEALCDRVLVRANRGWDFAAWRDALAGEQVDDYDRVILTNSSIIGPLYPLGPIFDEMDGQNPDVWGIVQLRLRHKHLQSYFLSASRTVVTSQAWQDFWASVQDHDSKRKVINDYEIGFSRSMRAAGFELVPLIEPLPFWSSFRFVHLNRTKQYLKLPLSVNFINRSVACHQDLIRRGMPYLKASLVYGKDRYRFVGFDRIKRIPRVSFPFDAL